MDNLTKAQRSKTMALIKSEWTLQEKKVHNWLKSRKIKHIMHPQIIGSPDVILTKNKTAIFLNGCFWHKCPKCYKKPKTNKRYWNLKIKKNIKRDEKNKRMLKKMGFKVVEIWEHEIKSAKDSGKFKTLMNHAIDCV